MFSIFKKFKDGLTKTVAAIAAKTHGLFGGRKIDTASLGELEEALYTADFGVETTTEILEEIKTAYRKSIQYSLNSVISYVETYGDDNLVLIFLGDHQPSPVVIGDNTSRDVPITIVAHDQKVLDQISGWGWQDGLRPQPNAPVWLMSAFRDRFLTAFGP